MRVEDGNRHKNIWIPNDLSTFVRVQWALDNRSALNKARVTDIVQGIVAIGYEQIIQTVDNRLMDVSVSKSHSRDLDEGDTQQYSIKMSDQCRDMLDHVVSMVETKEIKYEGDGVYNMSDAMITLLNVGVNFMIHDHESAQVLELQDAVS